MARNVSILVGKEERIFNGVTKLTTNKAGGGGTYTWVPEEDLGTKEITENGVYRADDDNVAGWDEINVNVPGGAGELGTKEITENGTYNAQDDGVYGFSSVTVSVDGDGALGGTEVEGTAATDIPAWSTVHISTGGTGTWQSIPLPSGRYAGSGMMTDGRYFYYKKTTSSDNSDIFKVPIDDTEATPESIGQYKVSEWYWDACEIAPDSQHKYIMLPNRDTCEISGEAGKPGDTWRTVQYVDPTDHKSYRCFVQRGTINLEKAYTASGYPNPHSMAIQFNRHVLGEDEHQVGNCHRIYVGGNLAQRCNYGSTQFVAGGQILWDGYIWGYGLDGQVKKVELGSTNVQTVTGVVASNLIYDRPYLSYGCSYLGDGVLLPLGDNGVYYNGEVLPLYGGEQGYWYALHNYLFCPKADLLYKKIETGTTISLSSRASDGARLGYVKEAIAAGETGKAYVLFS